MPDVPDAAVTTAKVIIIVECVFLVVWFTWAVVRNWLIERESRKKGYY